VAGTDDYVFSTAWGEPIHPDTVSSLMTTLINTHNDQQSEPLPHALLHDLRHVHATTLLLAGVPVHLVAARLGHADPSITLRVYAHVISDQLTEAADIFARAVAATTKVPLLARVLAIEPLPEAERGSDLGALGGTRNPQPSDP
jgi:integrase